MKIIYQKADPSEIPRFISLLCNIVGGPNLLITCFYGCPNKTSEKAKVFRRLYNHIYDISIRFGISIHILGGDFNSNLNDLSSTSEDRRTFRKLISDFQLLDAFVACPPQLNAKDKMIHIIYDNPYKQELTPWESNRFGKKERKTERSILEYANWPKL